MPWYNAYGHSTILYQETIKSMLVFRQWWCQTMATVSVSFIKTYVVFIDVTWSRLDWRDQFLCLWLRKGSSPCEENGPVLSFLDQDNKEVEIVETKYRKEWNSSPSSTYTVFTTLDDCEWTLDTLKRVEHVRFGKFSRCFHWVFAVVRLIFKGHNVPTLQWATLCSVPLCPCLRCLGHVSKNITQILWDFR